MQAILCNWLRVGGSKMLRILSRMAYRPPQPLTNYIIRIMLNVSHTLSISPVCHGTDSAHLPGRVDCIFSIVNTGEHTPGNACGSTLLSS